MSICLASFVSPSSAGRRHPSPWLRANKARRAFALATLRAVGGISQGKTSLSPTNGCVSSRKAERPPRLIGAKA